MSTGEPMKITLQQHGGLAGLRPPLVLETTGLAARDDVERLARLVASQAAPAGPVHPDEMAYTLVIADGHATHEARGVDSSATPEFANLAQQVRKWGKAAVP